jgi:cobalt-zinc-cadmium efflux system outer membrane protein
VVAGLVLAAAVPAWSAERELELEEVLAFAETHAPEIVVAERRVDVAAADTLEASPWWPEDPVIDLRAGGRVGGGQDGADVGVGLRQSLELFGERDLRLSAAKQNTAAVRLDIERVRFAVHQSVHRDFLTALLAEAEVAAAEEEVAFAKGLVDVAQARVNAGEASSLTVRLAHTALSRAKERALTALESRTSARLALGRDAGFDDATSVKPRGVLPVPEVLPPLSSLLAIAEAHRPQLLTLQAEQAAAQAQRALADREAMPKPVVGIDYSLEGATPVSSAQTQQVAGATLSLPLPLFRSNDAQRARAAANEAVIDAELQAQRRRLAGQIAEARTHAEAARTRLALFANEILPDIKETLHQLEQAYALGELDLTEVMVGREQVLTARRDALQAWRSWFEAHAALEAEVGAEWPASSASTASSPPSASQP